MQGKEAGSIFRNTEATDIRLSVAHQSGQRTKDTKTAAKNS
jgi:hypothetical protein